MPYHSIQRSLQCWHPNLWKFIDALKKEERLQRLSITQLLLGQVVVPKKTYRMTDEGVSNIVRDCANRTFYRVSACYYTQLANLILLTKHVYYKKDWVAVSDSSFGVFYSASA